MKLSLAVFAVGFVGYSSPSFACGDSDGAAAVWYPLSSTDMECRSTDGRGYRVSLSSSNASCREDQSVSVSRLKKDGVVEDVLWLNDNAYSEEAGYEEGDTLRWRNAGGSSVLYEFTPNAKHENKTSVKLKLTPSAKDDRPVHISDLLEGRDDEESSLLGYRGVLAIIRDGKKISSDVLCRDVLNLQYRGEWLVRDAQKKEIGKGSSPEFLEWLFSDLK